MANDPRLYSCPDCMAPRERETVDFVKENGNRVRIHRVYYACGTQLITSFDGFSYRGEWLKKCVGLTLSNKG